MNGNDQVWVSGFNRQPCGSETLLDRRPDSIQKSDERERMSQPAHHKGIF